MYCSKLRNICQHEDASKYCIDIDIIKKLDFFIKEKTTLRERRNINPIRFAAIMSVNEKTALMTFITGAKCKLFKLRIFIECECGDQHEITNMNEIIECGCERDLIPSEHRENIYLYFQLIESPTDCEWLSDSKYQIDYISGDLLGKQLVSLADAEKIAGIGIVDSILVSQRDSLFRNFVEVSNSET